MYRCLYFPDIEPNHRWLRQVLLLMDEVNRIVPTDVDHLDSAELSELIKAAPGAVKSFHPTSTIIELPDPLLKNLGKVLDQIKKDRPETNGKLLMHRNEAGNVEIVGWEFLHTEKVSPTLETMLEERGFINQTAMKIHSKLSGSTGWLAVPRGVSDVILSALADRIAEIHGFDAITDHPLPFALNAVSACEGDGAPMRDGLLASVVASYHVPSSIELLRLDDYLTLREAFSGARAEFALMVRELVIGHRLDRIQDPITFRRELDDICLSVGSEMEKAKASKIGKRIADWGPLSISTLLPIVEVFGLAHLPVLAGPLFSFGSKALIQARTKVNAAKFPTVLRLLAETQSKCAEAEIASLR
jgi:hypothetical protein